MGSLPPPDPGAQRSASPFDRSEANAWAQQWIAFLQQLLDDVETVKRDASNELARARSARRDDAIRRRLADVTVEQLAKQGSNIRTKALAGAGVRTAADVLRLGYQQLQTIDGVGEQSASQLVTLAQRLLTPIRSDLRPEVDTSRWSNLDVNLVRALRIWSLVAPALGLPDLSTVHELLEVVRRVEQATRLLRWATTGKRRRQETRLKVEGLRRSTTQPTVTETIRRLQRGIASAAELAQTLLEASELADDWRQRSAELLAVLESFVSASGSAAEQSTVSSGLRPTKLTPSLVRAIEAFDLDTQLLSRALRNYQLLGAKFAVVVSKGLLGDDMGLGKTIQALAAIGHVTIRENHRHHVVICPAPLVDNWLKEISATTPTLPGYPFREPGREVALADWTSRGGILVTSYQQATRLANLELPALGFVVADEGHFAKNPDANRTQATRSLIQRANRGLIMSGTMLENRAKEMIDLATLVSPAHGVNLRRRFGDGEVAHMHADSFRDAIAALYLRRNQDEVLDELPELVATDEPIRVGRPELVAYQAAIRAGNLMAARQALSVGDGHKSAKMQALSEIAGECRATGRKLLVFSFFRETLKIAADVVGGSEIHGDISQPERERRIARFMTEPGFATLVLQIDAGGTGLNLQAASVVVIMEPQYKPSTEWQAIGRARRMGQTQRVIVHRLVAADSVDAAIVTLTNFKAELFAQLARRSDLADSTGEIYRNDDVVTSVQLLADERERLGLAA